jgi:Pyruvate/2-oxoacid:ferredoxin oxidoreductase gamma subunit
MLLARLDRGQTVDLRGHGHAGSGLMLTLRAFAAALASRRDLDLIQWSLAPTSANAELTAFLRIGRNPIERASRPLQPQVVLVADEATAEETDFAEGTSSGLYVLGTALSPLDAARRFRLGGTVVTVSSSALAVERLGSSQASVAVLAALTRSLPLVGEDAVREALEQRLRERLLPERMLSAYLEHFDEALGAVQRKEAPASEATVHQGHAFRGWGKLPAGAQAAMRSSTKRTPSMVRSKQSVG